MSEIYDKRLTAPAKNNKYYYDNNIFYKCGYGMPNCTCYAWGRWYELLKKKPKLCTGNAENWYNYNDGYKRGKTPKLGAVVVWSKGKIGNSNDGAGHVAIVEEIYSDGSILTSNSAWSGSNFYTKKYDKGYKLSGYTFLGFIYPPVDFIEKQTTSKSKYKVGKTYKTQVVLKVRTGAGTNYAVKSYNQLTTNAKANAYSSGANKGCLKKGTQVTVQEVKNVGNDVWLRIPSGWVAGYYSKEYFVK